MAKKTNKEHNSETTSIDTVNGDIPDNATPDSDIEDAFIQAIDENDIEKVKVLITKVPDINMKFSAAIDFINNVDDITPLHWVNSKEIAKLLIDAGADVNARTSSDPGLAPELAARLGVKYHDETPLHWAKNTEIAKLLIDAGADVNAKNRNGETALFNQRDPELVKLLIDSGIDINAVNIQGLSALFAFQGRFDPDNICEICNILIDAGADLSLFQIENVFIGPYKHSPKIMRVLIDAGAAEYFDDDCAKDHSEFSPLHGCNNLEVAKMLVEAGADVNAGSPNGYPLDQINNEEVIAFLVENGAISQDDDEDYDDEDDEDDWDDEDDEDDWDDEDDEDDWDDEDDEDDWDDEDDEDED